MKSTEMVAPSPDAEDLAERMIERHDVMEAILDETLTSADRGNIKESGRTVCSESQEVTGPGKRFNRSVQLSSCPVGLTGTWHTHVTQTELQTPQHSLPDWANVIFGGVDSSVIVGVDAGDVVVAPAYPEQAIEAFQQALGYQVRSPEDVVRGIRNGQIEDPPAARQRVRNQLASLHYTFPTDYPELAERISGDAIPQYQPGFDAMAIQMEQIRTSDVANLRRDARNAGAYLDSVLESFDIKSEAISSATGIVVGQLVTRFIFGD